MATDIRQLDPNDPGYEEAVEAALLEEDVAHGRVDDEQQQPATTEEPVAPEAQPGEAATEATGPEPTAQEPAEAQATAEGSEPAPAPAAGVLSKDGKVLPYTVLKSVREEAKQQRLARQAAEAEAAQLRARLDAIEKGGGATEDMRERAEAGLLTDEERADFPALAKIEQALQKLAKPEEAPAPAPAATAAPAQQAAEPTADDVQDAIDSNPVLAGWQAEGSEKWKRAVAHDDVLRESPKWKDKPLAERFAHVARLVAEEFDEPIAEPAPPAPSPTPPAPPRKDPKIVAQEAKRTTPSTLSDFKGGAPESSGNPIDRLPAAKQVAKFSEMSDDEIDRHLARLG